MFQDVEFMTAREKDLVLKNWRNFLKHGLEKQHFTKRLYEHLHLHCGFIANFNVHMFHSTYFEAGQDTERFFEHFCNYTAADCRANGDYGDVNTSMRQVYEEFKVEIMSRAQVDITSRLDLLDACVKRSRQDQGFAREFLSKVRI